MDQLFPKNDEFVNYIAKSLAKNRALATLYSELPSDIELSEEMANLIEEDALMHITQAWDLLSHVEAKLSYLTEASLLISDLNMKILSI